MGKTSANRPQFWYEDNNVRRAGGYPPDFREMFEHPEKWAELRRRIDVYYIRGNTLRNIFADLGEDFVRDRFARVLARDGIPVAIDNPSGYAEAIPKLRSYGLTVGHIALQSTLSKGPKCPPEEMERRLGATVGKMVEIKRTIPDIKVGLICALPTKGRPYKELYAGLARGMKQAGYGLDFIHLDCPYTEPELGRRIDWPGVREVQRYVQEEIGAAFGFICASISGKESDKAFYDDIMNILERYGRDGAPPDHFVLMSWYRHPARSLPEDAPDGAYPMTKVGLDFARQLEAWRRRGE
jgi:hypothetical protein